MFEKLYKLIFGLDEFSKTQIELRFELAHELIDKLKVNSINDMDYLEACIYKIKDQLRVKSSNLNSVINNEKKPLTRKKVETFLQDLQDLRKSFLNSAFTALEQIKPQQTNLEKTNKFNIGDVEVELKTQGGFHAEVIFNSEIDLSLLRTIASTLFDFLKSHGTTLIIEESKALIIPRRENDNIINPIPQKDDETLLNLAYEKLISKEYREVEVTPKQEYSTQYYEDPSLESLVKDHSKDSYSNTKEEDNHQSIDFEKSDSLELEKKPKKKTEIEVEKTTSKDFIIYEDEEIKAELYSKSPVFAEILVSSKRGVALQELEDNEFSYLILFSKIFASTLFDTLQAHGTSILWSEDESAIHIIPRYQEDGVLKEWQSMEFQDDTLNQFQNQLLQRLGQETTQKEEKPVEKEPVKEKPKEKARVLLDELRKIP